jgi:hypothetical protein
MSCLLRLPFLYEFTAAVGVVRYQFLFESFFASRRSRGFDEK